MNEHQVGVLLTYCAAADARFNTPDAEQAQARVRVWLDQLAEVDAQFAGDYVRRYYAKHQDWPVQPGGIRTAWGHHVTAAEARERVKALYAAGATSVEPSEAARAVIAQTRTQIAEAAARGPAERAPSKPMRPVRDEVFGA